MDVGPDMLKFNANRLIVLRTMHLQFCLPTFIVFFLIFLDSCLLTISSISEEEKETFKPEQLCREREIFMDRSFTTPLHFYRIQLMMVMAYTTL